MIDCFGYIRVSTVKQGDRGVSLQEQRAIIDAYALRHDIRIIQWFEERLTAAKRGRPLFTKMIQQLRAGQAQGVVMHKIDRGARNLRDWADLADLIDLGVAVHFANDGVDLLSRGGRLSADIQAVVAADYVRNLREEARKGITGRLKQGLIPFAAPLGYLDAGAGKPKVVDPARGPLIRDAFQLYATGRFSIDTLLAELRQRGLTNRRGGILSRNSVATLLNNPFYAGLIYIKTRGESYSGAHAPLVSMALFNTCKARLAGRVKTKAWVHDFTLRGLFLCSLCDHHLIGEQQKGHVYYRCHTTTCPTRGFREEVLENALLAAWPDVSLNPDEKATLAERLECIAGLDRRHDDEKATDLRLRLAAAKERSVRLVDALVDGLLDKQTFEERKAALLEQQRSLEERLAHPEEHKHKETERLQELLELVSSAQQSYRMGTTATRRELAIRLCSNRSVQRKDVSIEPYFPILLLSKQASDTYGAPHPITPRTSMKVAWRMYRWAQRWSERKAKTQPDA